MAKPPFEYRPGRGGGKVAEPAYKEAQKTLNRVMSARVETIAEMAAILKRKRALKAAQMKRYRAKRKKK